MANYYFSFVSSHPLYNTYFCKVTVDDTENSSEVARDKFVSKFGTKWAMQYTEKDIEGFKTEDWWKWTKSTIVEFDELDYVPSEIIGLRGESLKEDYLHATSIPEEFRKLAMNCGWKGKDFKSILNYLNKPYALYKLPGVLLKYLGRY